jgi:hypothetical protein
MKEEKQETYRYHDLRKNIDNVTWTKVPYVRQLLLQHCILSPHLSVCQVAKELDEL